MAIDGQLNLVKEKLVTDIMSDQHLLKYLKYKDNDVDIPSQPNLTLDDKIAIKNKNIYEYRKAPSIDSANRDIWLSMEYGVVKRGEIKRNRNESIYTKPTFFFYIITYDELDKCLNGSRLYAIEDCLVRLFDKKDVLAFGKAYVVASEPMQLPYPYVGRRVTLAFYDVTDGVISHD